MTLLHHFCSDNLVVEAPLRFNNPFYYSPHTLCVMAADEVRAMLSRDKALADDAARGKMFGVLVVRDTDGGLGFLAAFSGLLIGSNNVPGFVPPVFDLQSPDGYFKKEEANISLLNRNIKELEGGSQYMTLNSELVSLRESMEEELSAMRDDMRRSKQKRDALRATGVLSSGEEAALVRESQFQKAEFKRVAAKWQQQIAQCESMLAVLKAEVASIKATRKQRSASLQRWLFEQYRVLNARGEEKCLLDIFSEHSGIIPPAGAGECAAPKLLQYAYLCCKLLWPARIFNRILHHRQDS